MKKPNIFTRALAALRLPGARQAMANYYHAAEATRMFFDWVQQSTSHDDEIKRDLGKLRARARDLDRNNSYAKRFLKLVSANVVGPGGIKTQPQVRNGNGELLKDVNAAIAAAFDEFWLNPWLDEKHNGPQGERLLARALEIDGEVFVRVHRGVGEFGLKLSHLDPDLIDHTYFREAGRGLNEIRLGIEIDAAGKMVAVHAWDQYPTAGHASRRVRISADDVWHIFDPERINQTRGVSSFAPVAGLLKILDGLLEAELVLSKIAASKMGFFVARDAANFDAELFKSFSSQGINAKSGSALALPPGVEFQAWDTGSSSGNLEPLSKLILRSIGAGLSVSYSALANDLSDANYSSMRGGELIDRDQWRIKQQTLIGFRRLVHAEFVKMATLTGKLKLPHPDYRRFLAARFVGRGWSWVDPLKDIQAAVLAINNGLATRREVLAEQGRDVDTVFEDLAEENMAADRLGLEFLGLPAAPLTDAGENERGEP